jgi:hypothetical protein
VLAFAGTAAAANSGNISVTLSPNKVSNSSTLTASASGFTATGLPTSADFKVQKGFQTSIKSVAQLCSASQASNNACPAASKIGSGTAVASAAGLHDTISFSLFLGPPTGGNVGSIVVTGSDAYFHYTATGSGELLKIPGGGLELSFPHFPSIHNLPQNITITLDSLSLTAHATRTVKVTSGKGKHKHKKKVTYSLITNPSTCTSQWTGSATVTFPSGPVTEPLSTPCTN